MRSPVASLMTTRPSMSPRRIARVQEFDAVDGPIRGHIDDHLVTDPNAFHLSPFLLETDVGHIVARIVSELHKSPGGSEVPRDDRDDEPIGAFANRVDFHLLSAKVSATPFAVKREISTEADSRTSRRNPRLVQWWLRPPPPWRLAQPCVRAHGCDTESRGQWGVRGFRAVARSERRP